jgi:DNA-binding helix-hairpin-helix protein with protein kinase domain
MAYFDGRGKPVVIGRQIGRRGGEGCVFEASSHVGFVVKIYHEAPDAAKVAKLQHLASISGPDVFKFSAWPRELVTDSQRKARGFLMPVIQGKEIHQLFQAKERFVEFPNIKWDFLIRVARNSAACFDEVHRLGVVIGDVNEGNILVNRDGTVRLIDCDSYQAARNGQTWTCDVGVPFWTPPELQDRHFRGLHRTPNHDLFGLAVLIFKLLYMGRHPFAGVPLGKGEILLEQAIAQFRFAFSDNATSYGVKPPPNSLPLNLLPKNHRDLFERAFTRGSDRDGARPSAREWALAMENLEKTLKSCASDAAHRFPSYHSQCPWCAIAGNGGLNFWVSVSIINPQGLIGVQIWDAINRIVILAPIGVTMAQVAAIPKPAANPANPERKTRTEFVVGWTLIGLAVVFFSIPMFALIVALVGCGLVYGGKEHISYARVRGERKAKLDQAKTELEQNIRTLDGIESKYRAEFTALRENLRNTYERLLHLDRERTGDLRALENKKRQIQLNAFLDRQFIANAQISGIGPSKKAALLAYQIESAFDLPPRVSVPGIGPALLGRLMDWRRRCEARFQFNPSQALPPAEVHAVNVKFANIRKALETELQAGPVKLQSINNRVGAQREPVHQRIIELTRIYTQAVADMEVVPQD